MEFETRKHLLDAGLELLARVGFREWSLRGAEDEAGVPHGTARHYFTNKQGLVVAMLRHMLDLDLPQIGESPVDQVRRLLGPNVALTRARYEFVVASFHDPALSAELVRGRERLVRMFVERGLSEEISVSLIAAVDGHILDCILRRRALDDPATDPEWLISRITADSAVAQAPKTAQ
ncbi:TetR/AcrR family transcriptional regulator [Tsukamurella strandjordii]|uniref:TetR/AcrR family transcriptional regulator n=1 Tax=Tsukamurella strandjordii TaxID=147577 RepID=A0AA90NJX8_9ACTN|nr:TetR/AcrR family transcriptional regulator [Tsukamurella strandjordii]MDP0400155.1 TetR/AcrR family transcriptional regulator [Tsukamurella strandjordii]